MASAVEDPTSSPASEAPSPPAIAESSEEGPTKEEHASAASPPESQEEYEVAQAEELSKVKFRRSRTAAAPKDTEMVELPEELDIFWLPEEGNSSDATSTPDLPPPEVLEEALNKLLVTLHPQVQHRAAYPPGSDPPVEPTLGLYCPIEGGEYVVDATVREMARQVGAEVLVLDSVQLAGGEWGKFGKAANSLHLPVNPLHLPSDMLSVQHSRSEAGGMAEEDDDEPPMFPSQVTLTLLAPAQRSSSVFAPSTRKSTTRSKIKVFFDTLINSSPKPSSNLPTDPSSPRPRIIYIRDFATLAPTSSTWYPPLLSAVRQRRRGPLSRSTSPITNPTTIVFGMSPSLIPSVPPGHAPSSNLISYLMNRNNSSVTSSPDMKLERFDFSESETAEKARERRLQERLRKWEKHELALFDEMPRLNHGSEEEGDAQKPEVIVMGPGGRSFPGLPPFLGGPSAPRTTGRSGGAEKRSSFFRTAVLVPAKRSHAQERTARIARRREINELSMRMGVGAVGGSVEGTPADEYFTPSSEAPQPEPSTEVPAAEGSTTEAATPNMWEDWGNRLETWHNVKKIADSAMGRVLASSMKSTPSLDATAVPWDTIRSAWSTRKSLKDQRRSWLKESGAVVVQDADTADNQAEKETSDEVVERVRNDPELDDYEQRLVGCIVDSASMPTSFNQVHLPPHTIDSVRTIVSLPLLHPHAFQQGILKQHSMSGCLLFGPPGTGKTLIVRALAKDAGCRMLAITPSDIMDMYVGEAEKLVRAVFSLARRLSPCVVFLDEIDALFGARMSARESGGAATAHRGVITEFMQEMDGLKSSKEDGVVVIGATNRPFDLDDAVLRRLPRRLLVDLPGEKERAEILKILLREETLAPDVSLEELARKTESFSGSDLKHLCVSAALDAVKEHFKVPWKENPSAKVLEVVTSDSSSSNQPSKDDVIVEPSATAGQGEVQPCVEASTEPSKEASTPPEPHKRVLQPHNFEKALKEITPSSSESLGSLADLRKWNDEFGEGRRGKKRSPWGRGLFGFVDDKKPLDVLAEGKVAASTSITALPPSS